MVFVQRLGKAIRQGHYTPIFGRDLEAETYPFKLSNRHLKRAITSQEKGEHPTDSLKVTVSKVPSTPELRKDLSLHFIGTAGLDDCVAGVPFLSCAFSLFKAIGWFCLQPSR